MFRKVLAAAFLSAAIVVPLSASAQGVPGGVERGAREGERAAGALPGTDFCFIFAPYGYDEPEILPP
jgi:hypothetical protein